MMIHLASIAQDLQDKGQQIAEQFGVNTPMLVAQIINFTLVAVIIYKFGFKGILSQIKEREKQISDSLKQAEKIKLELEETERKQEETLKEAGLEAKKTVSVAQEQAKSLVEAKTDEARKQAEEIIEKAKASAEIERQRVLNEARDEIASLVILATSKVLERELSDDEKSRFSTSAAREIDLSN